MRRGHPPGRGAGGGGRARAPPPPLPSWGCSYHTHFLRRFPACFSATGPSMWLLGRLVAGFSAPKAVLMLMMRARIPASNIPPTT